jgi:hypothetical protein
MSAPSKAKQRRIDFARGDYIVIGGEIVDGDIIRPRVVLSASPDETMEPYLWNIAELLNKTDDDSISFRNQLTGLPRSCRIDVEYLRNHFDEQVGKISDQPDQKDRLFTLRFHRRKMYWDTEPPRGLEIGIINSVEPPSRALLRRFRRRSRC